MTTYWLIINILDFAPNRLRRHILSGEYSGDALEERLKLRIGGGWRVFRALWQMSRVNMFPLLSTGDVLPKKSLIVHALKDAAPIDLLDLVDSSMPLVVNFGSCS